MKTLQVFAILFNVILIQAALPEPRWYTARDGSRYLIERYCKYNWYQAWAECARRNALLVTIDTEEKNNNIKQVLNENDINFNQLWIGGNDANGYRQDVLRPFYWSATGEEFSFTNWAQRQPNNFKYKEHCVYLMYNSIPEYAWKDNSCYNATMGYICEEKKSAQEGTNKEDIKPDSQNVNNYYKEVDEENTEEKITQQPEEKYIEHQTEESIHPKLLAGLIKPTENSVRNVNTQERDVDRDSDEDE